MKPIIIVGSGFAAYQLVKTLRRQSTEIAITVITADSGHDYSKPDLSHVFTKNQTANDLIKMNADTFAETFNIQLLTNTRVESVNAEQKTLVANGEHIEFSKLVLATGAKAFVPPMSGDAVDEILTLNSLEEYQTAQQPLNSAKSVLVIGAGLIGTEIAMDLASAGRQVILTDLAEQIMPALLPEFISAQLHGKLLAQGCRTELNTQVQSLDKTADGIEVIFTNGRSYVVDSVICAVGLKPNTQLAEAMGLQTGRGIVVDRTLQTSTQDIYSLGDCAEIEGRVLPFLQPIMLSANVLAKTLMNQPAQLNLPAMLIKVKTSLLPIQLSGQTHKLMLNGRLVPHQKVCWQKPMISMRN